MLSSYNGEKYIRELLDSIFCQAGETLEIHMLARDDGSSDSTVEILEEYSNKYSLTVISGENLKPAQSFMSLISEAPSGYDIYAFADQDDIWLDGKLRSAASALDGESAPTLWYCNIAYMQNGAETPADICPLQKANSLEAVCETFATTNGCTMVFNEALLKVLQSCKGGMIDMHDSFTNAMCLASGGRVIKDSAVYVNYRIHDGQTLGKGDFSAGAVIGRFLHPNRLRSKTVQTMLTSDSLTAQSRAYLQLLADYKKPKSRARIITSRCPDGLSSKQHTKFIIQILTNTY